MAAKLTEITTQYHTFVDNQVLTKDHLNAFISYFDDQDRLSRIFLSGVGIVCGFKLSYNASKTSLTITQGAGITTDGDLINLRKDIEDSNSKSIDLSSVEYSQVRKFDDNFANYRFFKRLQTVDGKVKEVPLDLWEVLPENTENANELGKLEDLEDKVVLLYLESYAKEGDLCTAMDCDNQGIEQVARLRVLLVSKNDADYIVSLDSVFSRNNVIDSVFELPKLAVRRVILNQLNTNSYDELKRSYYLALNENNTVEKLMRGILQIVNKFSQLLQLEVSHATLDTYFARLKNITGFSAYNVPFDVQYRYDLVKDLIDTYNEIRTLLLSLKDVCCPGIKAFPKHLMLGSLTETEKEIKHFRHGMYKSPLHDHDLSSIKHCRSLVQKWFQLISQFKIATGDIKITPSNKLTDLSFRSIPFYYNLNEDLLSKWNYFKTEKYAHDTNLSYHVAPLLDAPHIQEPMYYNIDNFDFYRIEGHQGKDYKDALDDIDNMKTQYGLAFDVKALSVNINSENLDIDDYECEFEDLNVLLKAWTAEQECVLAEVSSFFSGFSTTKPGINLSSSFSKKKRGEAILNLITAASEKETVSANVKVNTNVKATKAGKTVGYIKDNVISDNLNTNAEALGSVMKIALDETKGGSVNDIIARASSLVKEKLDDAWANQPEVKEFVIDNSIEIMAYSHVLIEKMPAILVDVDLERVSKYKLTLKQLCARVEKMKTSYQNTELSSELKAFMGVLITQLSSICCSGKKLEILLEEINKRKENILLRLQLAKFIEKNPGLEHKAGVEPGGTFVLVYLNKAEEMQEKNNISSSVKERGIHTRPSTSGTDMETKEKAVYGENEIRNLAVKDKIESITNHKSSDRLANIPYNTVVADFSLPYMCCSDCEPVNFIVQRPPVSLRLEQEQFCIGQDTSPLLFEVSPADGVIKADQNVEGLNIEGNKLFLDAENFPDEMIGKAIHFTVNDQITTCEVIVFRGVDFDFEVPDSPTKKTEIAFVPSGNLVGAHLDWDFGDSSTSDEQNPTHIYTLPVNKENKVVVSLTVTAANGICHSTVKHEIEFVAEEVRLHIEKESYCPNDKESYLFGVTPAGAEVKIEGPGVQQNNDGDFVFIPANAGPGEYEFKLNDEPSGVKVTVEEAPVAKLIAKQVENTLVLSNESTGADSFVWIINGEKIEKRDSSDVEIELTPNSATVWKLQIQAVSKNCGSDISQEIAFTTKFVEEEQPNTCIEETKAEILTDFQVLETVDIPSSDIVHHIWLITRQLFAINARGAKGVLNDVDNYLSGENNGSLLTMFEKLLSNTTKQLLALDPEKSKREFRSLLEILRLQLQLLYNILGCQSADVLKASVDDIKILFEQVVAVLQDLKKRKISMPVSFLRFMKAYESKVAKLPVLAKHVKFIKSEKLI